MESDGESIILEIEYDSEELLRPMLLQMKGRWVYRRLIDARHTVILNFLGALAVLYWLDLISVRSVLLAAGAAIFVSGFVATSGFEYLGAIATFFENKYRESRPNFTKPSYRFILSLDGIRREYQTDVDMAAWPDISSATETEADIMLSHHGSMSYFFPKRIFQDFNELAYFKTFIRDRIGDRAKF